MSAPLLHHSRSQPSHYDRNGLRTRSWADRAAVHVSLTGEAATMLSPPMQSPSTQRPATHDRPLRHVKSTVTTECEHERTFPSVSPSTHSFSRMKSVSNLGTTSPLGTDLRGRRVRTASAAAETPLSPKSSPSSILQPKRWSALLHWRSANGGHKGSIRQRDVNARFSHASAFPVPDLPKDIGTPFNVVAAPGSALDRARQSQMKAFGIETGEKSVSQSTSAPQMSKPLPATGSIKRPLHVRASKMESADDAYIITQEKPKFKSVHRKPVSISDMKRSRSATVTQGEVKINRAPTDQVQRAQNENRAPICNPIDEAHLSIAVGNVSEQSLYTLATDKSFFSEEQSYSTCPTPALDAASSEEGGSTPALTNEDSFGKSPVMTAQQVFHSPASLTRSLSRGRLSDKGAFQQRHLQQSYDRQQRTQSHAYTVDCGLPSLRSGPTYQAESPKWCTQPRGSQIEGEDLTNKLKLLIVAESEQDRQARLYAWRHHAEPHDYEHYQTYQEQKPQSAQGSERPDQLEPKASIVDFSHVAKGALIEREPRSSSYAEVGEVHGDADEVEANGLKYDGAETMGRSSLASESLLDSYAGSVQIRTAWREELQHLRLDELATNARASMKSFSSNKRNLSPSTIFTIRDSTTPRQSGYESSRSQYEASYSPERSPTKATSSPGTVSALNDSEQSEGDICSHLLRRDREHRRYAVHE